MRVRRDAGLALVAGIVVLVASIAVGRERAAAAIRPRFAPPLRTIVVAHMPDRLQTFARVDVARLRCGRRCGAAARLITSRASLARIEASLARVVVRPSRNGFDARWFVTTTDANGEVRTFACDRFGHAGAIDGRPVTFSNASPFLAELRRDLPPDAR